MMDISIILHKNVNKDKIIMDKRKVVLKSLTIASEFVRAETVEEQVKLSAALSILSIAINADEKDMGRLMATAKTISSMK